MHITYIGHSGYLLEWNDKAVLFDYYEGIIPDLASKTRLYVFVSHRHYDHFNFEIFHLAEKYPDICYILSDDIEKKFSKSYLMKKGQFGQDVYNTIFYIGPDCQMDFPDFTVSTLLSTDLGVAFILDVAAISKTVYYAGDLNWWTWVGSETEAEFNSMKIRYETEIKKLQEKHIDIAFLVIDKRQQERFYWGLHYFMEHVDTDIVFPMHFWNDFSLVDKLRSLPECADYKDKIMPLTKNGEQFDLS